LAPANSILKKIQRKRKRKKKGKPNNDLTCLFCWPSCAITRNSTTPLTIHHVNGENLRIHMLNLVPRPFPSSIRIGADVCHIPRIQAVILRHSRQRPSPKDPSCNAYSQREEDLIHSSSFQRWAAKVFNRLEWPELNRKLTSFLEGKSDPELLARWIAGRYVYPATGNQMPQRD
jgi:phosphopantetheinyl transferase (holo-ACP synthase)